MILNKYTRGRTEFTNLSKKRDASNVWRGISLASDILNNRVRKNVYNGANTLFWRDSWLGDKPLLHMTTTDLSMAESYKTMKEY